MSENFYRSFEDEHRGNQQTIRERFAAYMPLLESLAGGSKSLEAVDLGCGRGEWLEILREQNFKCIGVDLDHDMLEGAREKSLHVQQKDALLFLEKSQTESYDLISAFHLVEHLPFEAVRSLIEEAYRVLRPGGILILETPNPENFIVATSNFYIDPTHIRPIPHALLSFAVGFAGFGRTVLMRLHEGAGLKDKASPSLLEVFHGASPDYAVVAQKTAPQEEHETTNSTLDRFFQKETGISSEELLKRWDASYSHLVWKQGIAQDRLEELEKRYEELEKNYQETLDAIFHSLSWKITAPLRRLKKALTTLGK